MNQSSEMSDIDRTRKKMKQREECFTEASFTRYEYVSYLRMDWGGVMYVTCVSREWKQTAISI